MLKYQQKIEQGRRIMKKEQLKQYTNVIAEHIKNSPYSQKALADKLGIAISTMSGIAQAESDPKLGTLLGLADALHLSLDELTGYTVPVTVNAEPTELSPAQITRIEKSLIQLQINLSAIGNFQQNDETNKIIDYTQDCIQQILNGQKLKEEK